MLDGFLKHWEPMVRMGVRVTCGRKSQVALLPVLTLAIASDQCEDFCDQTT
jgi:hypothetical protein